MYICVLPLYIYIYIYMCVCVCVCVCVLQFYEKIKWKNGRPLDFPYSIYRLLILQMEVIRLKTY
jgi:hypothetical protein